MTPKIVFIINQLHPKQKNNCIKFYLPNSNEKKPFIKTVIAWNFPWIAEEKKKKILLIHTSKSSCEFHSHSIPRYFGQMVEIRDLCVKKNPSQWLCKLWHCCAHKYGDSTEIIIIKIDINIYQIGSKCQSERERDRFKC